MNLNTAIAVKRNYVTATNSHLELAIQLAKRHTIPSNHVWNFFAKLPITAEGASKGFIPISEF